LALVALRALSPAPNLALSMQYMYRKTPAKPKSTLPRRHAPATGESSNVF
jgi:hypothetical protein